MERKDGIFRMKIRKEEELKVIAGDRRDEKKKGGKKGKGKILKMAEEEVRLVIDLNCP